MNRKFIKLKKHTWFHRHNPFNTALKNRLKNISFGVPSQAPKSYFSSEVLDQGSTYCCAEFEAVAEQSAVDGKTYDPWKFLDAVCDYLRIPKESYQGANLNTITAARTDPGLTLQGDFKPSWCANGTFWIHPENGMDLFDTIQHYIEDYQRPVFAAVDWKRGWDTGENGIVPDDDSNSLGGHFTMLCGKLNDRMDNQNSWGINAPGSMQGHYYFSRQQINEHFSQFGVGVSIQSSDRLVQLLALLSAKYIRLIDLLT